ncbi:MAG: hypothetical protein E7334_05155 [Clostridiales bacterium]|nr:hypothetical protein [Clostridiales bacterium]MBQ2817455.1 hypothetical protein [Clostridia bacterium]
MTFKFETYPDGRQKVIVTEGTAWVAYRDLGGTTLVKEVTDSWDEGTGETLLGVFDTKEKAESV